MARLHLFNPESDLQLANGSPHFTAPKAATDLARAGAVLPVWYGNAGDVFLGAVNRHWYETMADVFGLNVLPFHGDINIYAPTPWGWSSATLNYFKNIGYDPAYLPSPDTVDVWRTLSSRATSAELLTQIMEYADDLINGDVEKYAPRIATTVLEAMDHIERMGRAMLKLPWSNAGRGQQDTDRTTPNELIRRVSGMISRQGSIEISPYYVGHLDFAMLFDDCRFEGYSLFNTDTHGGWIGNVLIDDAEIERRIIEVVGRDIDFGALRATTQTVLRNAAERFNYHGPAGIDFLVADSKDNTRLIVPVEINWRRTMGHVARTFYHRYMMPESTGLLTTPLATATAADTQIDLKSVINARPDAAGRLIVDGRLGAGSLDLVPPGGAFRFRVTTTLPGHTSKTDFPR